MMMNENENEVDWVNYVLRGGKLATKCRLRDVGSYFGCLRLFSNVR